jgi:hypothetical protein
MGSSLRHKWLLHPLFEKGNDKKTRKHHFFVALRPFFFVAIECPFPNVIAYRSIYCDSKTDGWACFFLPWTWCPTAFAIPHWKAPNKEDPEHMCIVNTFDENSKNSSTNQLSQSVVDCEDLLPRQAAIVAKNGRCNAPSEELLAAALSEQPLHLLTLPKVRLEMYTPHQMCTVVTEKAQFT